MKGSEFIGLDDRNLSALRSDRDTGWPLSLSGDGTVLAYRSIDAKGKRARVVVDGREGPDFDSVGMPLLSRNGRVIAYRAERNDEYFIRIGDRDEPACDFVTDPAVSADGSTVAYAGKRADRWFLKRGSEDIPISGIPQRVFLSDTGRDAGWVEHLSLPEGGSKMRVVAFGTTGERFSIVGTPVISPTEPLVAYGVEDEKQRFVVIGTKKIETPDRVGDPVFSPDGRQVGYGARIGREFWWKVLEIP